MTTTEAEPDGPLSPYTERVERPLSRLFAEYGRPEWRWLALGLVASVATHAATLVTPLVLGTTIDGVFTQQGGYSLPFVPASLVPPGKAGKFRLSAAIVGGALVTSSLLGWVRGVAMNYFAHGVTYEIRTDAFAKMQRLDASFFDEKETGETVALVGPTGAGKSTVATLLGRLYDVDDPPSSDRGSVRIDGYDVRDVTTDSLREAVGYVGQDAFLFDGTIAENVRYGEFDAARDEVVAAAKAAQAHEFIAAFPDGYDTHVGERGVKLSGGQRQRIALARTVLRDPSILVLDEATSAVDTETEMRVQRSLDDLAADRTTIAIAHRLSTVRDADEILVLEDGAVVERGTHEELLAADGLYATLWSVQSGTADEPPVELVE